MTQLTLRSIRQFQKEILGWYVENKRDLPWRRTRDPYQILVSEIMLQQTQVARVIPKYEEWLRTFPTVESLAKALTRDVLRLWSGLGYNRRALYLQKTAQILNELRMKNYELWKKDGEYGYWPRNVSELEKLPGIGKYTAGAVACFAFDQQIAVVDTNIRKVILTRFCHPERREGSFYHRKDSSTSSQNDKNEIASIVSGDLVMTEKEVQEIANQLLTKGKAYAWNQALMDYSAAMLRKEKVPVVRQSKFKGSNRYFRGKILRILLENDQASVLHLSKILKPDEKDPVWLDNLLRGMEKDGLLSMHNGIVAIK